MACREELLGRRNIPEQQFDRHRDRQPVCLRERPRYRAADPRDPAAARCSPFPDEQIDLVIRLAQDILERNPTSTRSTWSATATSRPVGASTRAPCFPGSDYTITASARGTTRRPSPGYRRQFNSTPPDLATVQGALNAYGYPIEPTGEDDTRAASRSGPSRCTFARPRDRLHGHRIRRRLFFPFWKNIDPTPWTICYKIRPAEVRYRLGMRFLDGSVFFAAQTIRRPIPR